MCFDPAVCLGIEVCSLLHSDVVLRNDREILVRGQAAIECGIVSRVDLHHTVRQCCAVQSEIIAGVCTEIAARRHCAVDYSIMLCSKDCAVARLYCAVNRRITPRRKAHIAARHDIMHRDILFCRQCGILARRNVQRLEVSTRTEYCIAFRRDILCGQLRARVQRRVSTRRDVLCGQLRARHNVCVSINVHILCGEFCSCLQRRVARRDVVRRQLIVRFNGQHAVRAYIAVKDCTMRFQFAVRLRGKVRSLLCNDIVLCRNRKVLVRHEVGGQVDVLRVNRCRAVREHCRIRREIIADIRREIAACAQSTVKRRIPSHGQACTPARRNKVVHCEVVADVRNKFLARSDRAVCNEILADMRRKCFAHVGLAAECHVLARCQLCVSLCRNPSQKCDILVCGQRGISFARNTRYRDVLRLRVQITADTHIMRVELCPRRNVCVSTDVHIVCKEVCARIQRRVAARRDVLCCDIYSLGVQITARRNILRRQRSFGVQRGISTRTDVLCRDIYSLRVQIAAHRHIIDGDVCPRGQHSVAARRDVLCRKLLIRLNGQRAVCVHITAEAHSTGFQSAVCLRGKVCPLLCNDIVLCRNRKVLVRHEVGVQVDVLRVNRCRAVREHCRMRREIIADIPLERAVRCNDAVCHSVVADNRRKVSACRHGIIHCEVMRDIRRKSSTHVGLAAQCHVLARCQLCVMRRERSCNGDILVCGQHGISFARDTRYRDVLRLRVQIAADVYVMCREIRPRRNACISIDVHILCKEVCARVQRRVAARRDVLCCHIYSLGVQIAAHRHIIDGDVCPRGQHSVAARRDVLCRKLLIRLNGQRAVCVHITAEAHSTGFQSAVCLRGKVCPLLCKDIVLCRNCKVLVRHEVGVQVDALRVNRCRAVREHLRIRREVLADMRRKCFAHVGLAAECHIFVRRQLCAMRRERSSNGDILRRQHSLRIAADRAVCLDLRLRREGCLAFARDVVCSDIFVRLRVQIAADVQVT